jgi:uncharacterized protein (DUF362 family)
MDRRTFLRQSAAAGAAASTSSIFKAVTTFAAAPRARVAFVVAANRADGVKRAIALLEPAGFNGKDLFIKPNFNSGDPTPGSTHIDTLNALVGELRALGAGPMTIGDRSGMGVTRDVMAAKDIPALARDLKVKTVVLDELPESEWDPVRPTGMHWQRGFAFPRVVRRAGAVVQTCCLKTHRFGGHFTLSLKNSVGFAAKQVPGDSYNYMTELHRSPNQRRMIAEINTAYQPAFVVMDAMQAFTTAGPDTGTMVEPRLMLAATDWVALDAVGVAVLRHFGTTPEVSQGSIFQQEQIARAVELGIGVGRPDMIDLVTDDRPSAEFAATIRARLQ